MTTTMRTTTTRSRTPSPRGRRAKAPPIQDVLKRGQDLIVQVSKEPISTKGPRVTAQVSLAGRFLVYMPFAVARRREPEDRRPRGAQAPARAGRGSAARRIPAASSSAPSARTSRRRRSSASSARSSSQWKKIKRKTHFVRAPALVHRETSLTRGLMRDVFSTKVEQAARSTRSRSTTRSSST